jgi:hypothetical protein
MANYHPLDVRHKSNRARPKSLGAKVGANYSSRPRTPTGENISEGPWGDTSKITTARSHNEQFHTPQNPQSDRPKPLLKRAFSTIIRNIVPIVIVYVLIRTFVL